MTQSDIVSNPRSKHSDNPLRPGRTQSDKVYTPDNLQQQQ